MSFSKLKLSDPILKAVAEAGYTSPTAIQKQAIPIILSGRDLVAAAQTGKYPCKINLTFYANSTL